MAGAIRRGFLERGASEGGGANFVVVNCPVVPVASATGGGIGCLQKATPAILPFHVRAQCCNLRSNNPATLSLINPSIGKSAQKPKRENLLLHISHSLPLALQTFVEASSCTTTEMDATFSILTRP